MKNPFLIVFSLSGLIFFGCTENFSLSQKAQLPAQQTQFGTSQTQISTPSDLTEIAPIIEQKLSLWVELWRNVLPDFSITRFKKIEVKKIVPEVEGQLGDPDEEDRLNEILNVYSPDQTKYIDPHLDMSVFEEGGKLHAGLDVDSGVALADLKNNTWKRLMFCGTPCHFDDAAWINNDVFVVVGESEYYEENYCLNNNPCPHVATLHVFDLSTNVVTLYYGPPIEKDMSGYLHLRFPQLQFD